ncbi:MAG: L,D-transpeptidase family protein [Bacteroidota bacterium]
MGFKIIITRKKLLSGIIILLMFILFQGCNNKGLPYFFHKKQPAVEINISPPLAGNETLGFFKLDTFKLKEQLNSVFNDTTIWNEEMRGFYQLNDYDLAWIERGRLNKNALVYREQLALAEKDGLERDFYFYREISQLIDSIKKNRISYEKVMLLEALLTRSYLDYASGLLTGHINPDKLQFTWVAHPISKNLKGHLSEALDKGEIRTSLEVLKPKHVQYEKLKYKLAEYREIKKNGGWPIITMKDVLQQGDTSMYVDTIRKFLYMYDNLVSKSNFGNMVFDDELEKAVKKFQERNGLEVDGILGNKTYETMSKTIDDRIGQIIINMERIRWIPENFGEKYIIINIPEFVLRYYEKGDKKLEMKVVVGKIENYTPVLKDTVDYIVFSPEWRVPNSISREEILPAIKKDSDFLARNQYEIYEDWTTSKPLNPDSIPWESLTKDNFTYRIVQKPGPWNALGRIKFMFPNNYNIYLHDTPQDHLFEEINRDFSHGCVRLEKPFELADYLLHDSIGKLDMFEYLEKEEPYTVSLPDKVPVHFIYRTAWCDEKGNIHFRKDLYKFDKKQLALLRKLG